MNAFRFILFALAAVCAGAIFADEPSQVRVSVSSQPSGATVIVDGMDRGTTPVVLYSLSPGRHHLKYRLPGYVERDRFFSTAEGPFIEKNEVMVEEKGLLLLRSDPEGANIYIDGVAAGVTPRLITHLAAKDAYAVKLRMAGYQDHSLQVKFDGRKPLVREEKLVLASGVIDVMSEPAGAEVTVNGLVRGKTPMKVTGVPKGRAVVKFHLDGFEDEVRELAINAGDVQTLPVVLKGLPGTLHLSSVPAGARFYVNDVAHGKGPVVMSGLQPGEYLVRAELEGYGIVSRTVTLANGGSANEEFRLSNVMGRLEVRTSPPGARLTFDGRVLGTTKSNDPQAEFSDVFSIDNVLEGEHVLTVNKDGYSESIRHPKIQRDKTSQHRIRMRRIFKPDVELVTSRGSYTGIMVANSPEAVVIEVSLGITRSFPRDEIRKITFLNQSK